MDFYECLERDCDSGGDLVDIETVVLGDFNTNILKKNSLVNSLNNFMRTCGLSQLIDVPTRVTDSCASIIDLIMVTDHDKIIQSGVLGIGLSDHMPIYCTRKIKRAVFNDHNTVRMRSLKGYTKDRLCQQLDSSDWPGVLDCHDVCEAWSQFKSIFLGVLDVVAPSKEIRIKQSTEPWLSSEILDLIRNRDRCLNKYRKSKNQESCDKYLFFRNQVNYKKNKAKSNYYVHIVNENQNKPKKLWQALKSLATSSKCKTKSCNIGLKINDVLNFDKTTVATHFNTFLTTIASTLVDKLPQCSGKFGSDYVKTFYQRLNVDENKFVLNRVTNEQVLKVLGDMSPSKATGMDNIPASVAKDGASILAHPITHIVNQSLCTGVIPDYLKLARVVPLYTIKSKTDVVNYRPVSVLCILSKVFERIVFNQLNEYLVHNNLLCDLQSGFRSSYSTDTCLIYLHDYIRDQCDIGHYTGMVLLDLQKTFDTVNHDILLSKMNALGVSVNSVGWFRSYLSGKKTSG